MMPSRSRLPALALLGALALLAGCASAAKEDGTARAYVPDPVDGRAWAVLDDRDEGGAVALAEPAAGGPRGEIALVRVEAGRVVNASPADLEAVRGSGRDRVAVVGLSAHAATAGGEQRIGIGELRRKAGAFGAQHLLIARFEGESARRRLRATLHETRDGRVVGTYGPGEPSLALALHALRQPPPQPRTP